MTNIIIHDESFYEKFEEELKTNKDIINFQKKERDNTTFISAAASAGYIDKVAYLLEKKADFYLLDDYKENTLHKATYFTFNSLNDKKEDIKDGYQIFRLLLNWEAEQRAFYPKKYTKQILLKDQKNDLDMTSLARCERNETIYKELQKAIDEAENYHKKCKIAKEQNIAITPYHRQFLPDFLKTQYDKENISPIQVSINIENTWSKKIRAENRPLMNKEKNIAETGITEFFRNLLGNYNDSKKVKTN